MTALCSALVIAAYTGLDRWQRNVIFSVEMGDARWAREAPQGTEIFSLPVSDSEQITTWYVPAEARDAPTVLYLHGSRWNLNSSVFRIEHWHAMGYNVLAIDYRGFGGSSPGLPSQKKAREDAHAALNELARRQPDPSKRFLYGHSLGGAVAIDAATQAKPDQLAGLIVESSFTRIEDMIMHSGWAQYPGLRYLVTQPFDSLAHISQTPFPTLLIHGTADQVIPDHMSDQLHAAALKRSCATSQLVKLEGASHTSGSRHPDYVAAVQRFTQTARQHFSKTRNACPAPT